ncbi:MAG: hypothetical protein LBK61_11780 [Spirochaetaceae bacterium]|nr:hypothetical protein [Spirochaetaceae bacterium]
MEPANSTPLRSAPAGSENPLGFHLCFSHPFVKPIPNSGRESAVGGHVMR